LTKTQYHSFFTDLKSNFKGLINPVPSNDIKNMSNANNNQNVSIKLKDLTANSKNLSESNNTFNNQMKLNTEQNRNNNEANINKSEELPNKDYKYAKDTKKSNQFFFKFKKQRIL